MRRTHPKLTFFLVAAIILLTFAAYSNTFRGEFIWDDIAIQELGSITSVRPSDLARFFYDVYAYPLHARGEFYRPLYMVSFAIDYRIHGQDPWGYHFTNILLHAVFCVLLFFFASSVLKAFAKGRASGDGTRLVAAFLAAAVFAVHPAHTESVAWIKGRDDILSGIFALVSIILYMRSTRVGRAPVTYLMALAAFVLALLSKEIAFSLPLVLLLYELCHCPGRLKEPRTWAAVIPFFIISGLFLVVRTAVLGKVAQMSYLGGGFAPAMYTTARGFVRYFELLTVPLNQCADYMGFPLSETLDTGVMLSFVVIGAVFASGVVSYRFSRPAAFSILLFFVAMLPVSNVIPIKIQLAERFLYVPSVGYALLFGVVWDGVFRTPRPRRAMVFLSALYLAVIALYFHGTLERNKVWANEFSFWADVIKTCPNARAYNNYGQTLEREGRMDEAAENYRLALGINPQHAQALHNLAAIYLKRGRTDEALGMLEEAVRLSPVNPVMHTTLGDAYRAKGMTTEAMAEYKRALEIYPGYEKAMEGLEGLEPGRAVSD